ncbi:response regulator [Marivita sp.]|uniref:response regulator n=1 Tax=Marivita sp. TaxID=2003365 RepID=UPI0025BBA595|nr:response regulator [Marivita sp.]
MSELRTILHVDDDEDILEIARMALELVDNFELHQFSSGPDALEGLKTLSPQLLLLDVMMPGMTGLQMSEIVKSDPRHGDIATIFMTAKAEDTASKELLDSGALDVITKPFDPMSLGEQIRTIWATRKAARLQAI